MKHGGFPTTPGFLEGLIPLLHGIGDARLLVDSPDCTAAKLSRVAADHDHGTDLHAEDSRGRLATTNLLDADFIAGTESKTRRALRRLCAPEPPGMLLLAQASVPILMGTEAERIAAQMTSELGVPVAAIASEPLSGCWVTAFSRGLEAVARVLPLPLPTRSGGSEAAGARESRVGIVGHIFARHEEDVTANVRELRRLCTAIDLDVCALWLDGGDTADLARIAEAGTIVALPHAGRAGAILAERTGSALCALELPVGLAATTRFLRGLALAVAREDAAERLISEELDRAFDRLEWVVRESLAGASVALVAEPVLAAGLAEYLYELGLRVVDVALHTRDRDAPPTFSSRLPEPLRRTPVWIDPATAALTDRWRFLRNEGSLDLVIATSNEAECVRLVGVPQLELGFPCAGRHALFDAPWLGFHGAMWLADQLAQRLGTAV